MELPEPKNWKIVQQSDYRYVWKHQDYPLWMKVSYKGDHYDENGEQVYRVHGRAAYGPKEHNEDYVGSITFNQYKHVICDDGTDREDAFNEVISWAKDWMESYQYGKYELDF